MNTDRALEQSRAELAPFSRSLVRELDEAAPRLRAMVSETTFGHWCDEALQIARTSFRSWETAAEFLRVSPSIAERLDESGLLDWARLAREMTGASSIVAAAYIQVSPRVAGRLDAGAFARWTALGARLHGDSWKSISLATRFFEESPALLDVVGIDALESLVDFLAALAVRSYDAASDCLENGGRILARIPPEERESMLGLARRLAPGSWKSAQSVFKEGPALFRGIADDQRRWVIRLTTKLAEAAPDEALEFLKEMVASLASAPAEQRTELATKAEALFERSWRAATAFVRSAPAIRVRAGDHGLDAWFAHGTDLLAENEEAGSAFFRMQSSRAKQVLEFVSPGIGFDSVRTLLQMYCEALCGRRLRVGSTADLKDRGVGWTNVERPATDGASVHLPAYIEEYGEKQQNFVAFKVLATHQTAHLEFGTFAFVFDRPSAVFAENLRETLPVVGDSEGFERFFDAFENRALAKDLFSVAEDFRIDQRIRQEYPGIRRALTAVQGHSLANRPAGPRPLQEQLVELLIRLSLSMEPTDELEMALRQRLAPLAHPAARVEDACEATIRLYRLITQIPNSPMTGDSIEQIQVDGDDFSFEVGEGGTPDLGAGQPYQSPEPVQYRDELKPELVEAMARARESAEQAGETAGITPEQLGELLEKSGELDLGGLSQGEVENSLGMFVTNIMREAGQMAPQQGQTQTSADPGTQATAARHALGASDPQIFVYDEWDFRANDYRPQWCRLKEQVLQEGSQEFFERTLLTHHGLVSEIRRQFELLRPEAFKRIKNLQHGEEFDLDATIEAIVQRRARQTPSDKIYWRKNKSDRDVAVAFLLDMSASTDEEIEERPRAVSYVDPPPAIRWDRPNAWRFQWDEPLEEPRKRIIDVEKESLVLLIKALETIGDTYGIFGFSGYGRDNVEFFTIKDLDERLSDKVKRRVDKISPVQGTRMGPALRHCVTKLRQVDAKLKLLILVSDGRPQDHEYGRDRTEKDYAIHDTRMALLEAKRNAIVPFCLTVDRFGHDYLKAMCGDIGYEVVYEIGMLPKRLPTLYRRLTT
ncbi:MAG: hypothetical protein U0556_03515 [Dehalococcoidia bacterium]